MSKLLGPRSVDLMEVHNLDRSEKTAETSMREFVQKGPRIDAVWAANDPMALGAITAFARPDTSPVSTWWWAGSTGAGVPSSGCSRAT